MKTHLLAILLGNYVPASLFFMHAENIRTFPVEKGDFKGIVLQWKQIDRMEQ